MLIIQSRCFCDEDALYQSHLPTDSVDISIGVGYCLGCYDDLTMLMKCIWQSFVVGAISVSPDSLEQEVRDHHS